MSLVKSYEVDAAGVRRLVVTRVKPVAPLHVEAADEATAVRVSRPRAAAAAKAAAAKPAAKAKPATAPKTRTKTSKQTDELAESSPITDAEEATTK